MRFAFVRFQPGDRQQPGRDASRAADRHLDQRLLGHADRVEQLTRFVPATVRGLVPAEPLDGWPGPEGLPRGQRSATLRRHVSGIRRVPDVDARPPARRRRSRVRRPPGARRGRGRCRGPRRPARLPVLLGRVPVLHRTRAAPGQDARPAATSRVL